MVDMAKPWKHPQTGTYHLRRQIPAAIRAAFAGRQLHKVSLGTRDAKQATAPFLQANAELDIQFGEARERLARLVEQVALHHDVPVADLPEELASVLAAYLDALSVGTTQARKLRAASGRLHFARRLKRLSGLTPYEYIVEKKANVSASAARTVKRVRSAGSRASGP